MPSELRARAVQPFRYRLQELPAEAGHVTEGTAKRRLVEDQLSTAEIVAEGYERETVMQVQRLLYLSEYKRFQSAPGVKLTARAFWLDRRYPIVNKWRDQS